MNSMIYLPLILFSTINMILLSVTTVTAKLADFGIFPKNFAYDCLDFKKKNEKAFPLKNVKLLLKMECYSTSSMLQMTM